MKSKKGVAMISVAVLMVCVLFGGCGKAKDFDAVGYVKASLDAAFHGEYEEYAKLLDTSTEDAKKQMETDYAEAISQEFTVGEEISEEGLTKYTETQKKADALAKYEVTEAEKTDNGDYVVKVKVEPSDVYQTLEKSAEEVSLDKVSQGLDPMDMEVFSAVLVESLQKSIDKNTYGEAATVEVTVTKDDSGAYGLEDSEMEKIEAAMFPS